jgi:hypothetical protein
VDLAFLGVISAFVVVTCGLTIACRKLENVQ